MPHDLLGQILYSYHQQQINIDIMLRESANKAEVSAKKDMRNPKHKKKKHLQKEIKDFKLQINQFQNRYEKTITLIRSTYHINHTNQVSEKLQNHHAYSSYHRQTSSDRNPEPRFHDHQKTARKEPTDKAEDHHQVQSQRRNFTKNRQPCLQEENSNKINYCDNNEKGPKCKDKIQVITQNRIKKNKETLIQKEKSNGIFQTFAQQLQAFQLKNSQNFKKNMQIPKLNLGNMNEKVLINKSEKQGRVTLSENNGPRSASLQSQRIQNQKKTMQNQILNLKEIVQKKDNEINSLNLYKQQMKQQKKKSTEENLIRIQKIVRLQQQVKLIKQRGNNSNQQEYSLFRKKLINCEIQLEKQRSQLSTLKKRIKEAQQQIQLKNNLIKSYQSIKSEEKNVLNRDHLKNIKESIILQQISLKQTNKQSQIYIDYKDIMTDQQNKNCLRKGLNGLSQRNSDLKLVSNQISFQQTSRKNLIKDCKNANQMSHEVQNTSILNSKEAKKIKKNEQNMLEGESLKSQEQDSMYSIFQHVNKQQSQNQAPKKDNSHKLYYIRLLKNGVKPGTQIVAKPQRKKFIHSSSNGSQLLFSTINEETTRKCVSPYKNHSLDKNQYKWNHISNDGLKSTSLAPYITKKQEISKEQPAFKGQIVDFLNLDTQVSQLDKKSLRKSSLFTISSPKFSLKTSFSGQMLAKYKVKDESQNKIELSASFLEKCKKDLEIKERK